MSLAPATEPIETVEQKRLRTIGKSVARTTMREHPTLVLTLAYLGLTAVGLMRDWWFYRYFGINILDYSETGDFLLAAIRNPLVILLGLLPVGIIYGAAYVREAALAKSPKYRAYAERYSRTRWNSVGFRAFIYGWFVIVYAALFTQLYSFREVSTIKAGAGTRVSLIRTDGVSSAEYPIFLGSTAKFFFLYYPSRKETEVVPIENTTVVTVDARRRRDKKEDSALALKGDTAAARRLLRP